MLDWLRVFVTALGALAGSFALFFGAVALAMRLWGEWAAVPTMGALLLIAFAALIASVAHRDYWP